MIESISISNFKSIKENYFPLRNLNVLTGLNGMGKSSFIQVLLALGQSRSLNAGKLSLNGELVRLGNTKDVLYQYAKERKVRIELKRSKSIWPLNWCFDLGADQEFFFDEAVAKLSPTEDLAYKQLFRDESLFIAKQFQYLSAIRKSPRMSNSKGQYQVLSERNIGVEGDYAVSFLDTFGNEEIGIPELAHERSPKIGDDHIKTLATQVNFWMREISPGISVRTTSYDNNNVLLNYDFQQPNYEVTNQFRAENVGVGISYVLPVVVALLKARPGDLLIIENPESHVHPRGQSKIGKMIAIAAMNGVQIVLETHSDHVVNGIRVAVKEKQIDQDKVVIFYFEKAVKDAEQYSEVTTIEIDQNGELSEYPTDMLDEWGNQLMKLI